MQHRKHGVIIEVVNFCTCHFETKKQAKKPVMRLSEIKIYSGCHETNAWLSKATSKLGIVRSHA
jgi:hypothetical protein